mgnify:CR=1 FL=1
MIDRTKDNIGWVLFVGAISLIGWIAGWWFDADTFSFWSGTVFVVSQLVFLMALLSIVNENGSKKGADE